MKILKRDIGRWVTVKQTYDLSSGRMNGPGLIVDKDGKVVSVFFPIKRTIIDVHIDEITEMRDAITVE